VFGFIPGFLPLALALAGIIFYLARVRRDLKFVALVYFICAYWLSTSAFYILSRFRVPLLPVLGIPAGAFIAGNLMLLKSKKRWKFYFFSIPCLLFGLFITMVAYDGYQEYLEAYISAIARPSGVSLKIDDGKYMYLDNSPYSCGGWRVLKMKRGMFCAKKFAVPAEMNFSGAVFSLFLFCENPGEAEFRLNGKKHTIDFSKGLFEKKFSISQFSDLIKFELVRSSAEIYIFTDSRRNYGRTHINGKKTKSEIVCRLYGLKNNYTGKSK
jgi:hypothetical protein